MHRSHGISFLLKNIITISTQFLWQRYCNPIVEILQYFEAAKWSHKRKFAVKSIVEISQEYCFNLKLYMNLAKEIAETVHIMKQKSGHMKGNFNWVSSWFHPYAVFVQRASELWNNNLKSFSQPILEWIEIKAFDLMKGRIGHWFWCQFQGQDYYSISCS